MKYSATVLALLFLGSSPIALGCKFEKSINATLDLSASQLLNIRAAAGGLIIRGGSTSTEAQIKGKACAHSKAWLDEIGLKTETGDQARITVLMPDKNLVRRRWFANRYALLDL